MFIFLEIVDLCVWVHLQMYWSKLFKMKMKRLGGPKVGSGGVKNPVASILALDVLAYVCDDILTVLFPTTLFCLLIAN